VTEIDDFVPLSGLQHLVYCERQAALIHVERVWEEDASTAAGRILHERTDLPGSDFRRGAKIVRGMALRSDRLGIIGRADAVELREDPLAPLGVRPFPVEFKRGRIKNLLADRVQLCAQAVCLEERFRTNVSEGALFYGASHRRVAVLFNEELRTATWRAAARLQKLIRNWIVPPPEPGPKCRRCSLREICQPWALSDTGRDGRHLSRLLKG
jgi:CRISPR-associated exonuclease Cas4